MQTTAILSTIEQLLDKHDVPPGQRQLAHALSLAGTLASLLHITPAQLLHDLQPAYDALAAQEVRHG